MTTNTTTQALESYGKAAEEILALIDDLGFTTERGFDPADLKDRIVGIIVLNAKVSSGEIITVDIVEEQEPTEADLDEILTQLKEEEEQEQHIHANECPACGQLVR